MEKNMKEFEKNTGKTVEIQDYVFFVLGEGIEKKENDVQMDLEKVYDNFSDHYIKPLRRKLPVTGTKMNWNLHQVQYGKH